NAGGASITARVPRTAGSVAIAALLAHQHRLSLALEVDVLLAADVDGHASQGAPCEAPGLGTRVVAGDARAAVAADAQALAGDHELAGLRLGIALAVPFVVVRER